LLTASHSISCTTHRLVSTCTATPALYSLSLHDALPIYVELGRGHRRRVQAVVVEVQHVRVASRHPGSEVASGASQDEHGAAGHRSEEHTSELQSRENLVCRLLLEKKKNSYYYD